MQENYFNGVKQKSWKEVPNIMEFKEWGKIPVPLENSEHILMEVLLHLWLERVPSGGE